MTMSLHISLKAAESKIYRKVPTQALITLKNVYYCDALVGSEVSGWSKKSADEFPSMSKRNSPPGTVEARLIQPTDRLVFVLDQDKKTLLLSSRDEYELGQKNSFLPDPLEVLQVNDKFIIAFGDVAGGQSTLVNIERSNGLSSWISTQVRDPISHMAKSFTYVLACGESK